MINLTLLTSGVYAEQSEKNVDGKNPRNSEPGKFEDMLDPTSYELARQDLGPGKNDKMVLASLTKEYEVVGEMSSLSRMLESKSKLLPMIIPLKEILDRIDLSVDVNYASEEAEKLRLTSPYERAQSEIAINSLTSTIGTGAPAIIEIEIIVDGGFKQFGSGRLEQVFYGNIASKEITWSSTSGEVVGGKTRPIKQLELSLIQSQSDGNDNQYVGLSGESDISAVQKPIYESSSRNNLIEKTDVLNASLPVSSKELKILIRKLTLVSKNEELTIYLRDYHLTETQLETFMDDLSAVLDMGYKMSNFLVNGKNALRDAYIAEDKGVE